MNKLDDLSVKAKGLGSSNIVQVRKITQKLQELVEDEKINGKEHSVLIAPLMKNIAKPTLDMEVRKDTLTLALKLSEQGALTEQQTIDLTAAARKGMKFAGGHKQFFQDALDLLE
ncbi:MAG: hypothetical protein KAW41_05780 [Candidatus Diapherotrites archaeon]|nr:hypothetical protein [Candidatus Diapherotrites archaeon]